MYLCICWIINCLIVIDARCKHEDPMRDLRVPACQSSWRIFFIRRLSALPSHIASNFRKIRVNSDLHREVDENCPLLGSYAASSGNLLPKFRGNLSILSSGVKNPKTRKRWDPISCPQTSARYYNYSLRNNLEERSSQITVKLLIFCKC